MGHIQPPTMAATGNTSENRIVNGTEKQSISRAIDMHFYLVRDRIQQNNFHIFWEEGNKNLADYVTKNNPIWNHRTMRPRYLKSTKNTYKMQKTGELLPEEGVTELPIPGEPGKRITP